MAYSVSAEEEIDYDLICPVCQDEFNDPVIIDCHHSFCRSCIGEWIQKFDRIPSRRSQLYVTKFSCPACKSINKLPQLGVSGLPTSFYIQQLKNAKSRLQSPHPMCPKHKTEDLRFYCKICEILICRDCKVINHEGHTCDCVADVAKEMKATLSQNLEEVKRDLNIFESDRYERGQDSGKLARLKAVFKNKLETQAREIKGIIDKIVMKEDKEICKLFEVYETDIEMETKITETNFAKIKKVKRAMNQEIKHGSDHSVIANYKKLLADRQAVVVNEKRTPKNYELLLVNVYQEGTISETELENMLRKPSFEAESDDESNETVSLDLSEVESENLFGSGSLTKDSKNMEKVKADLFADVSVNALEKSPPGADADATTTEAASEVPPVPRLVNSGDDSVSTLEEEYDEAEEDEPNDDSEEFTEEEVEYDNDVDNDEVFM